MVHSMGSARKGRKEGEHFLYSRHPLACTLPQARRKKLRDEPTEAQGERN
jgi:hypothetical protein